jgi:hypothetical protein
MTMPRLLRACLLVVALLAPALWAQANPITKLKRPTLGCAKKADLENLARLMNELPKGRFRTEALRAYGQAHCVRLLRGSVSVDLWEKVYVCVHRPPHICVWVERALIEETVLDDGVF